MDEIRKIPPVTRTLVLSVAAVTLPVLLTVLSPYYIIWLPRNIFSRKLELWRVYTSFFFGGGGIPFIFDTFLLFRNSNDLEERHFMGRTAEYAWALVLMCATILAANYPLKSVVFFHPLLMALTHLWGQTNPTAQVSLFGLINVPAPYFPFALLAIDLVKAGPGLAIQSFTGIAAAHLWFFLTTIYPRSQGGTTLPFLTPPQWFRNLPVFRPAGAPPTMNRFTGGQRLGGRPASAAFGGQAPVAPTTSATSATGGVGAGAASSGEARYRWGSGQRLGS